MPSRKHLEFIITQVPHALLACRACALNHTHMHANIHTLTQARAKLSKGARHDSAFGNLHVVVGELA